MDMPHEQPLAGVAVETAGGDASDETIVERVRSGQRAAFEVLMRRHNQLLYRVVRAILRDQAETEDVLQETYVRAFMHLDQFLGRARFSTWLTRIAVHEALHRRKRRQRFVDFEAVADGLAAATPNPEERAVDRELRAALEAAIDRLPEDFRTVFVLRDVEGLSTTQTAESLEIREATVKTRLYRARRQLRRHLDTAMGQPVREVFGFGRERCDRLVAAVMRRIDAMPRDGAAPPD
ncbi:MAG: RNA polymerase sigma factor [bacterium]